MESEILGFEILNSAQVILAEWKATPDFLAFFHICCFLFMPVHSTLFTDAAN